MIRIFFVSPDQKKVTQPMFTKMIWETHRKGSAGSLELTVLDHEDVDTSLGTSIHVYWDQKRIMVYRIFERILQYQFVIVHAYDQLFYLIQSKESLRISVADRNQLLSLQPYWDHTQERGRDSHLIQREYCHAKYIDACSYQKDISTMVKGVFASDVLLQFAKQYQLRLEYIDYSDSPIFSLKDIFVKATFDRYGFPSRITNKESVLDIIQSYMSLTTVYLNEIYVLYDGGDGLCYRRLLDMRTHLLFTLETIGDYQFKEYLPSDYFNRVDFYILAPQQEEEESTSKQKQEIITYQNWDRIQQLGIFHTTQDITDKDFLRYLPSGQEDKTYALSSKTSSTSNLYDIDVQQVLRERILYYETLNEVLPTTLQLKNVKGSWKVRGGSIIAIELPTFDHKTIQIEVVVESAKHHYLSETDHTMDLQISNTFITKNPYT